MHIDIEPTQIGRVFAPGLLGRLRRRRPRSTLVEVAKEWKDDARIPDYGVWAKSCQQRKGTMQRKTAFDAVPIKPQRVYQEMNRAFGPDTRYVSTIGLSQIQAAQLSCDLSDPVRIAAILRCFCCKTPFLASLLRLGCPAP